MTTTSLATLFRARTAGSFSVNCQPWSVTLCHQKKHLDLLVNNHRGAKLLGITSKNDNNCWNKGCGCKCMQRSYEEEQNTHPRSGEESVSSKLYDSSRSKIFLSDIFESTNLALRTIFSEGKSY